MTQTPKPTLSPWRPRELSLPVIKVCGVTREADLAVLRRAGVTAVGINFVPSSPRCVTIKVGRLLAVAARKLGLVSVAVVRDAAVAELIELLDETEFDLLQLHGSERPELLDQLGYTTRKVATQIIKALSWSGRQEEKAAAWVWSEYAAEPDSKFAAWLIDAYAPNTGGGTGRLADWEQLVPRPIVLGPKPIILAGGLVPSNVGASIRKVRPDGVDTASGVERSPGEKSAELVNAFASQAREAYQELAGQADEP